MKQLGLLVFGFVVAQLGCAAIKPVARTVADLASMVCEGLAAENRDQLQGLSPEDWCSIQRNLDPFLDAVLAAKQKAGLKR
jgi:hypothetical protein